MISPWRWLAAIIIPIIFVVWGLKKKSVDISGAIFGKIYRNIFLRYIFQCKNVKQRKKRKKIIIRRHTVVPFYTDIIVYKILLSPS